MPRSSIVFGEGIEATLSGKSASRRSQRIRRFMMLGTENAAAPGPANERLIALARKVADVHGARHPELAELAHLAEDVILYPASPETRGRLAIIRKLARDFIPPADACNSYRALFRGLETMEAALLACLPREEDSSPQVKDSSVPGAGGTDAPRAGSCCGL